MFTPADLPPHLRDHIEVDPVEGCWRWTGRLNPKGYGVMSIKVDGRPTTGRIHRMVWELLVGPIPDDMAAAHLCHDFAVKHGGCTSGRDCPHRRCCRPDHLSLMTTAGNNLNIRRAKGRFSVCAHGHDMTDESNIYMHPDARMKQPYAECRTCKREARRAWKRRHRQARGAAA